MTDSAVMMAVIVLGILAVAAVGLVRGSRSQSQPPDLGGHSSDRRREHDRITR
jgi:hypothetical protein